MSKTRCAWFISLLSLSCSAFAADPWTLDTFKNVEVSAAIGPNWAYTSSTHLIVSPWETDSVLKNNVANHALWKLGIGYHFLADKLQQRSFFNDLLVELSLYQSSETIRGDVWQYQLPEFNNFSFSAPVTSTRLMLDVKPSLFTLKHISLYPVLGIGNSWNNIPYNETVTATGVSATDAYSLNSSTNSNFAYDLGVGLRADFTEHLGASLEYLYTNLGNMSSTRTSKNSNAIISPPTFNIYNQSLLLGISWNI